MMNRRAFIKSMLAGAAALATADLDAIIEKTITETAAMSDGDFVTYITMNMNLLVSNPAKCAVIENITDPTITKVPVEPIGPIGGGMKHHFHCINCKITFHLNFMPRHCLWCGIPATDPQLKLPNFIDIEKMKGIAKQIHDVQRTLP